jgi:serine/threonine protein kinase
MLLFLWRKDEAAPGGEDGGSQAGGERIDRETCETEWWRVLSRREQNDHVTSAQSAMPDLIPLRATDPREVGVYRLLGRLGEGGQGVVFLAVGPDEVQAAVKLLPPTTNPQVRSRFLKEVAAAQRVARFCTAQVLDAGIFERRPFIVSEYVNGPSLVEVVEQYGPHIGAALDRIAIATLTALGAVHSVGMVHRDFKPGNVLLGPDGPVVIDFGLAAVPGMTTTGMSGQVAIGTPAYMAPEQLAGERVTAAADMWSWAVTMAYAGTGELPFRGESLTATAYAILHSQPQVGRLPEPLSSLVYRCLNKDPAVRPSARDALGELVAAGARLVGPMPPRPPAASDDGLIIGGVSPRPRRRRHGNGRASSRWRAAALLTVILAAASAGGLALTHFRSGPLSERGASLDLPTGSHTQTSPLVVEAAVRARAVTWIRQQVNSATLVACDSQVCAALIGSGFPSSNVVPVATTTNDTLNAELVVVTAAIRSQFQGELNVDAPAVIASFGTGKAEIQIRWVYSGGVAQYNTDLPVMLRQRKSYDAQLLTNSRVEFSAKAKAQLRSGQVDPWLPDLVAIMAESYPVSIVDFRSQSPGGGQGSLIRWMDLATDVPAAHLTAAAYIHQIRTFLDAQRTKYHPDWDQLVKLPSGQTVLQVGFGAPSPLNPQS